MHFRAAVSDQLGADIASPALKEIGVLALAAGLRPGSVLVVDIVGDHRRARLVPARSRKASPVFRYASRG